MRHRVKGFKLGRDSAHRVALLRNISVSVIEHGKVKTTLSKAKFVKPFLEKLITRASRKGRSVHNIRVLLSSLHNNSIAVNRLIDVIGTKYKDRNGGYLRIVRTGRRNGDNAEMAVIEFV